MTICRLAQTLGPELLTGMLERLVSMAQHRRLIRGRRRRVDTTVVETNIRYPTDSRLQADGIEVLVVPPSLIPVDSGNTVKTERLSEGRAG